LFTPKDFVTENINILCLCFATWDLMHKKPPAFLLNLKTYKFVESGEIETF